MPGPNHGRGARSNEKAKNFKGTMLKLIQYLKPYYIQIFFSLIFILLSDITFRDSSFLPVGLSWQTKNSCPTQLKYCRDKS